MEQEYKSAFFLHPAHEEIAKARYYLKDGKGELVEKEIEDVFKRVAMYLYGGIESSAIAQVTVLAMLNKQLLPGGRILAQAGTRVKNLLNCFVIGADDNRETIMELNRKHFVIQTDGGGVGLNASVWRPRGSWVAGNQSRSCGAIGFISLLSTQASIISQGGNRSGANLAILEDWHPDLLDFIEWKSKHNWFLAISEFANIHDADGFKNFEWNNPYQWQHFNVSVGLSDKFMNLLKTAPDTEWQLQWKDTPWTVWKYHAGGKEYEITAPDENLAEIKVVSQLPFFNKPQDFKLVKGGYNLTVAQIWHRIAKNAHDDGCPGVFFIDRARAFHNGEYVHPIEACNPCAEEILPRNSVCCLGAVNIYYCMNADGTINEEQFRNATRLGIVMLNKVIDCTRTGIDVIDGQMLNERRIGLGITGMADALIKAKLKYSSEAGREFVRKWLRFFRDESYRMSVELAERDGPFVEFNFEGYSKSLFFKSLPGDIREAISRHGIRNITCNTIAPYGTTGTMMGTSTGCEPHFAMQYKRNSRVGSFDDGCFEYIQYVKEHGTAKIPGYFESSYDVSWEDHLKMQAVFAEFIDASVSKTINLPKTATISDVKKAYEFAFDSKYIKSTTVYVDGSKQQILETKDGSIKQQSRPKKIIRHDAPKRPDTLPCEIHRTTVKGTPWVVMVGMFNGEPYEVFAGKQKLVEIDDGTITGEIIKTGTQGGGTKYVLKANGTKMNIKEVFENDEQAALTRQISMNLRHGTNLSYIVAQLDKSGDSIVEFSKAIGRVLNKYIKDSSKVNVTKKCPVCKSVDTRIVTEGGCEILICNSCGQSHSKCD